MGDGIWAEWLFPHAAVLLRAATVEVEVAGAVATLQFAPLHRAAGLGEG